MRPEWHDLAQCKGCDPDLFYPIQKSDGSSSSLKASGWAISKNFRNQVHRAISICNGTHEYLHNPCPVKKECREYGLKNEKYGVWGGVYIPLYNRNIAKEMRKNGRYEETRSG